MLGRQTDRHGRSVRPCRLPVLLLLALLAGASLTMSADACAAIAPARPGAMPVTCDVLADKLATVAAIRVIGVESIASAAEQVGAVPVGEHCKLTAAMHERKGVNEVPYAIDFEMRLPKAWNGRFWYQANEGLDGVVKPARGQAGGGPLTSALAQGFVVLSSNAGHSDRMIRGPGFGYDPQARLDYGYRALGALTPVARRIIEVVYGRQPDTSYIGGCSNGGRHALIAAGRYAADYDGFLVGAPALHLPVAAIASLYGAQQYARVATDPADLTTAFTDQERVMVSKAVLATCDALDGLADGMIAASKACRAKFRLADEVPGCAGKRDGSCLSAAQKDAIGAVFSGATTAGGRRFYAPFPFDAGIASDGFKHWEFEAPFKREAGAVAMVWSVPPVGPVGFDGSKFALGTPVDRMLAGVAAANATFRESAVSFIVPIDPTRLDDVATRGAKIIAYHGTSDPFLSVVDTEDWFEALDDNRNGRAAEFARLFEVPGMGHCAGGPAADQFDMITPLVRWVEQGDAPASIVAAVRGPDNPGGANPELPAGSSPTRSRLLCPYPQISVYDGHGDPEKAASFNCQ
ncbi:MAG: tannase/feruloyl esterase family alpha/beta hydrolase [Burkholderiaceae bacterium]